MWIDDASAVDMLFYTPYADTIADFAKNENLSPLTIGLYGSWGSGKSSLLRLIQNVLEREDQNKPSQSICITLNAWQFEGYEDAKIAIMESLLSLLQENQSLPEEAKGALAKLFERVDLMKLGVDLFKKGLPLGISALTGNPLPLALNLPSTIPDSEEILLTLANIKETYLKPKEVDSQTENARKFREDFSEMLSKTKSVSNLVVIIDDLDRCSPDRIIDTLESVKLFLSVPKTTFIVAVDERVIEYAVNTRYPRNEVYEISKDYIEKIIQIPVKIPELSPKDLENYLLLLVFQLHVTKEDFTRVMESITKEKKMLADTALNPQELMECLEKAKEDNSFKQDVEVISKISNTVSASLKGNPRQAKRFMNTFFLRKKLAHLYYSEEEINLSILAKLLALETIDIQMFRKLHEWHFAFDGSIQQLKKLEEICSQESGANTFSDELSKWNTERLRKWILSEPTNLSAEDLSKYFYLSRESLFTETNMTATFTEEEKAMLSAFTAVLKGQEDELIENLKNMNADSQRKIVEALLHHFKDGTVELLIIRRIYVAYTEYREDIHDILKGKDSTFFTPGCAPQFVEMTKVGGQPFKSLFDVLEKTKKIKPEIKKKIFSTTTTAFTTAERK